MPFCTITEVRNTNTKLKDETKVPTPIITDRITEADATIIVDLSNIATEAELLAVGSDSKILNLMSKWKSTELTLAYYYGATRNVDQISDIDYWRKKYDDLLAKIISGEVEIVDASGDEIAPVSYPTSSPTTTNNFKVYPRKGIPGVVPDGAKTDYKDDPTT